MCKSRRFTVKEGVSPRLSFIPNTSELAFLGLAKQAQDHLDLQKAEIFKALKSNNGHAKLNEAPRP